MKIKYKVRKLFTIPRNQYITFDSKEEFLECLEHLDRMEGIRWREGQNPLEYTDFIDKKGWTYYINIEGRFGGHDPKNGNRGVINYKDLCLKEESI